MHLKKIRLISEAISDLELMTEDGKRIKLSEDLLYDDTCELVPIETLIKLREFDRRVQPKYNQDDSNSTIDKLKRSFIKDGILYPLKIDYYQYDKCVLLVEGNHRLNAAIELGIKEYPCVVYRLKMSIPDNKRNVSYNVPGYQEDEYGYVPANLKPSQIGLI